MRKDELESNLISRLDDLDKVPDRNPHVAARGKSEFLKQAASIKAEQYQGGWSGKSMTASSSKQRLQVLKPVLAFILIIAILFGGTAATVYAAQGSLPDQPLYQVKTWSEDFRLAVTRSPQSQLDQYLEYADRRILEMEKLLAANRSIPPQVQIRLQTELNQALQLAAAMEDQQTIMELERIHLRVEFQLQRISRMMAGDLNSPDPVLALVQTSLQQHLQMAAKGITNIKGFRNELQNQLQENEMVPSDSPGSGQGEPNYSQTITPSQSGQPTNNNGSSSGGGEGPSSNSQTMTPSQNGPYYGQKTPSPSGNKP